LHRSVNSLSSSIGIKHKTGFLGESAAAHFLRQQGYKILVRNYVSRWGEIDIVCRHANTLVFVEVKARSEASWEKPAEAVTKSKQRRIIRTAYAYLQELEDSAEIPARFDVVEVYLQENQAPRCELITSAFALPDERV